MRRAVLALAFAAALPACAGLGEAWRGWEPPLRPEIATLAPEVHHARLEGGLEVYVVPRPGPPLVTVALASRAGSAGDPVGAAGLAVLTHASLLEGAGDLDAEAYTAALADLGANPFQVVGPDGAVLGVQVTRPRLAEATRLLALAFRAPRFAPADVARRRDRQLDRLRLQADDPLELARRAAAQALFGPEHPYGRPPLGQPRELAGLAAADVRAFHRRHVGPATTALILVGDVGPEEGLALARRVLGDWRAPASPPAVPSPPVLPSAASVVAVAKPGLSQATVLLALPGPPVSDPRHARAWHATGNLGLRLMGALRARQDFSYGAQAAYTPLARGGEIVAWAAVRTDVLVPAARAMRRELGRLRGDYDTPAGLELARVQAFGRSLLEHETLSSTALAVAALHRAGLPPDTFRTRIAALEALSGQPMREVVDAWFDPARARWVIVADPAVLAELDGLGLGEVKRLPAAALLGP